MIDNSAFLRSWEDVSPGDPWQPEPAERFNALNALLRTAESPQPDSLAPRRSHPGFLTGINSTATPIPAGKAVVPVTPLLNNNSFSDDPSAGITTASAGTSGVWGITMEKIPAYGFGTVALSGIITVDQISGTADKFATPGDGGSLYYASSGRAEVLKCNSSGKALILLGGGGAGNSAEYNGMFKIIRGTQTLFKVVDGASPDSGIAGYTDFGPVNSAAINQTGAIWLQCRFTGTQGSTMSSSTCEMSIVSSTPSDQYGKVKIGETFALGNNQYRIVQWWRNNAVYWRTWYIL